MSEYLASLCDTPPDALQPRPVSWFEPQSLENAAEVPLLAEGQFRLEPEFRVDEAELVDTGSSIAGDAAVIPRHSPEGESSWRPNEQEGGLIHPRQVMAVGTGLKAAASAVSSVEDSAFRRTSVLENASRSAVAPCNAWDARVHDLEQTLRSLRANSSDAGPARPDVIEQVGARGTEVTVKSTNLENPIRENGIRDGEDVARMPELRLRAANASPHIPALRTGIDTATKAPSLPSPRSRGLGRDQSIPLPRIVAPMETHEAPATRPVVQISIGRIHVRGGTAKSQPLRTAGGSRPAPVMSLQEYLALRGSGRSG